MTKEEVRLLIRESQTIFDVVRLVDVSMTAQITLTEDGEMKQEPYQCYAVWNKQGRCENCISAKAFAQKCRMTKFEFVDHDVYYVVSKYLEIDDEGYILELVTKISDETLFGVYGKNEFSEAISDYNKKLYMDSLTGAYNRRYYEEQLQGLPNASGVAMIDVDNFKQINDRFGHLAGDMALKTIVQTVLSCVRTSDAVVRYGGDEFMLIFRQIPGDVFKQRLETIRESVRAVAVDDYPELHMSVSIGGRYCESAETDALQKADEMLYQAKTTKDRVEVSGI
ncbi:MAG: GGDEF domain-containing protein [Clostridia bacterium]|nr:GGDEF domain-containing protein [Lachnospiraceae bacterium]NCB99912.1 GGDEF domain-containing protein [Clostridia bacterium]NCD03063.1 GGDEF domain-containing protein [Clostridia bacterium]